MLSQEELQKLGIALAILYVVYKYVPNEEAKVAAVGVAGVIVASRVPYLRDAFAA